MVAFTVTNIILFQQILTFLDDECITVEEAGIEEGQQILIEGKDR